MIASTGIYANFIDQGERKESRHRYAWLRGECASVSYAPSQIFLSLLHNAGLMALVVMAYSTLLRHAPKIGGRGVMIGVLFGLAGVLSMADPIRTPEGIQLDSRTVMAALAAPFGGLVATLIAAFIMGVFRIVQGGAGVVTGLAAIAMASTIGYAFYRIWRGGAPPTPSNC